MEDSSPRELLELVADLGQENTSEENTSNIRRTPRRRTLCGDASDASQPRLKAAGRERPSPSCPLEPSCWAHSRQQVSMFIVSLRAGDLASFRLPRIVGVWVRVSRGFRSPAGETRKETALCDWLNVVFHLGILIQFMSMCHCDLQSCVVMFPVMWTCDSDMLADRTEWRLVQSECEDWFSQSLKTGSVRVWRLVQSEFEDWFSQSLKTGL